VDETMSEANAEDGWTPRPELLAAYADGELADEGPQAALYRRLEAWLAAHPEMAYEIEGNRRLTDWFRATIANDPGTAAWAPVLARLRGLRLVPTRPKPRWIRVAWIGAAGAACVWLAFALLYRPGQENIAGPGTQEITARSRPAAVLEEAEPEVFPVATAAEVEILSVKGEDTTTVVVGELPVEGSLPLLQVNEVTLTHVEPARDNMVPEVRRCGSTTFIWAPLDAERDDLEEPNP
jgi:hypothetical protein